jgi:hypothetical protein
LRMHPRSFISVRPAKRFIRLALKVPKSSHKSRANSTPSIGKRILARDDCDYYYKYNKKLRQKYDFAAAIVIVIKDD